MVADCIAGSPGVLFLSSAYFYGWEIHIARHSPGSVSLSAEESQAG